ncbi:MAG: methenyltetrahydromethanopterin cyclohydrolase [Thermoproteota archaeon]
MKPLSINRLAVEIVEELKRRPDYYGVKVQEGAPTIIDAGVKAKGGYSAGKLITEISMGGCGTVEITFKKYEDLQLPSVMVYTDFPVLSTMGSQLASWKINEGDYNAIGSGPARALALHPKDMYQKMGYQDDYHQGVAVLETDQYPPVEVTQKLAKDCGIPLENLTVILTPTSSLSGATQISGRIVETGIHKLAELNFNLNAIQYASGYAPIPPLHPKFMHSMGRTNDTILYGGVAYYNVCHPDDEELEQIVNQTPSQSSRVCGKPFLEIFQEADYDFYKIDNKLFAPAVVTINNLDTGRTFTAGEINVETLKKSLGL